MCMLYIPGMKITEYAIETNLDVCVCVHACVCVCVCGVYTLRHIKFTNLATR